MASSVSPPTPLTRKESFPFSSVASSTVTSPRTAADDAHPVTPLSRESSPASALRTSPGGSRSSSRRRTSFASVQEDVDAGLAQSFVDSRHPRSPSETTTRPGIPSMDMHQTPEFCCPCGGFRGWKQIRLGGKSLSRSYNDLRLLGSTHALGWAWDTTQTQAQTQKHTPKLTSPAPTPRAKKPVEVKQIKIEPGLAPIERMPPEVLDQIISHLAIDIPPNGYTPRNVDLIACLLTSRTLHAATLSVLYRTMTFPHSIIFSKALNHLSQYPALGTLVRRLDFSHFTSVGLGRTKQMNAEIQNLTSTTLLRCLDLLPNLKECLLQEHVESDISADIVRKLFTGLPNLQAVDLCGCSSQAFSAVVMEALTVGDGIPQSFPNFKRVSLHECSSLPPVVFETLLPRLVNVTHLDLAHTQISEAALFSLPETARITHLNLARCSRLSGRRVVEFLTTHPAVCDSLVYLNLLSDPSRYRLLEQDDVAALLPRLPSTLRSLNLGGAKVTSDHVPALIPLTKHLEELGLSSADLSVSDINTFFTPPSPPKNLDATKAPNGFTESESWTPSTLCYLDLAKVSKLTVSSIFNTNTCVLLTPQSYPLQVIEFSDKIIAPLRERAKAHKPNSGWAIRELGRRGWYVRDPSARAATQPVDDGSRWWKMGARWWGMRKIPVAVGDVGGIYGHYMFKK